MPGPRVMSRQVWVGSFGALATLLYALPSAPIAQPRIIILAHLLCGTIAVILDYAFDDSYWYLKVPLTGAIGISMMALLGVPHPPAGAFSVVYARGSNKLRDLKFMALLMPAVLGCTVLIVVAIVVNNLSSKRKYPLYW